MKTNSSKRQKIFFGIVTGVVLSAALLFAGQSLVNIKAAVDRSVITIGDRITYTLTIEHAKNIRIKQPGPGANLGMFEIKDYQISEPVEKNGLISQTFTYQISVFDTGHFVIPPFPIAYTTSDTSRQFQIIQSEPIKIYVKSVLTAQDHEIHDIKAPLEIPYNYRRLVLFIAAGVLILLAIGLLYYLYKRKRQGAPLFRREVIRPAHEIALGEIAALQERWEALLADGQVKLLFTKLSDILRRYLENRFFIPAREETSAEILQSLEELDLDSAVREKVARLLNLADAVKFARYQPNRAETDGALTTLLNIVEETKLVFETVERAVPVEEEEAEGAGAVSGKGE